MDVFGTDSSVRAGKLHVCLADEPNEEKKPPGDGIDSAETGVVPEELLWTTEEGIARPRRGLEISCISPFEDAGGGGVPCRESGKSVDSVPKWRRVSNA